jgi:hypothetical protein
MIVKKWLWLLLSITIAENLLAHPQHIFINKTSHSIAITITFYPKIGGQPISELPRDETTIFLNAGKQKTYKAPYLLKSVEVEDLGGKNESTRTKYELSESPCKSKFFAFGNTAWEYEGKDKLTPTKGVRKGGKEPKSTNPIHSITNKSDNPVHVRLQFYGCDEAEFRVEPGKTATHQNPCQLKYIEIEEVVRSHSTYGPMTDVNLNKFPSQFKFYAPKGTTWIYYFEDKLIPTKGVQFIGKELLDQLEQ